MFQSGPSAAADFGSLPSRVAYLMVADKYLGPLASRLSGVNQPVTCPPTVFSTHHRTLVTCIGAYLNRSTPAYQPPLFLRLSGAVATAVPDRGAPLSATIRGPSVPPPLLAYTVATASPSQFRGSPRKPLTAGASSHGAEQMSLSRFLSGMMRL